MKGHSHIPDSWTTCLFAKNDEDLKKDKEEIGDEGEDERMHMIESQYSEFNSCLMCWFKWKHFNFDPNLNYTDFKKTIFNKDAIKMKKVKK